MSNISTIYDSVRSNIATLFTSKIELINPDNLIENSDIILKDSFGVMIGPGIPLTFLNSEYLEQRSFNVILTKEVKSTENNKTPLITAKKALLEEVTTMKQLFLNVSQLSIDSSVQMIDAGICSAITPINSKTNFISCSVEFLIQFSESIV